MRVLKNTVSVALSILIGFSVISFSVSAANKTLEITGKQYVDEESDVHSISADYYTGITSDRKSLGAVTVNGDYTILAKQNDVDAYLVSDDKNLTIEYLYHDEIINPRGLNSSISLLIKEFHKGNPQLHISLARLNNGKIQIFDGQHKAVAQIMLGVRELIPTLEPIDWKTK